MENLKLKRWWRKGFAKREREWKCEPESGSGERVSQRERFTVLRRRRDKVTVQKV
ncbi:hypothetical protein L195_g047629 [Trifolium pratense]|uniref:Uncharacterized protein n=1 Tax=Trifolium pratense TaxID=57577 RepID=A0A2K3ML32_TRIPR|nr:hypothetical protein L195_g047629 [Trifolium pratense]